MSSVLRRLCLAVCGAAGICAGAAPDDSDAPFSRAAETARARVVKLYGAQVGQEPGCGSGVVIGPDGTIVTTLSLLLEARSLRTVLADGRRLPAEIIRRDEQRQLALLRVDATDLPFFELGGSAHLRPGDWVLSAANPFHVAAGSEPVSVALGVFSGRVDLDARRRTQDFSYDGPVLLTDVIVTAQGCAGGALVDVRGDLVGIIGKRVISQRTNTWVNYALPVEEIAAFVAGRPRPAPAAAPAAAATTHPSAEPYLGIQLFDIGGQLRPAYVERVRRDSPARQAGVCPDDLVVSFAGQTVGTCDEYRAVLQQLQPGQRVELVVKRGNVLKTLELVVGEQPR
ncbi:MAG: trypsin-like peptidase domain-containing protein [Planctomycetes bacterium]|nr:trypsin-like peptidase domain-containing protein [Planctomycetota bacterium]